MKINSPTWNVTNPENLYKSLKQKLAEQPNDKSLTKIQDTEKSGKAGSALKQPQEKKAESVLTEKEVDTLRALFGESKKEINQTFYGRSKPQNVQAGYFLDIKG
jgi:hypothetical protein